jgi:hypothetical protein
MQKKQLDPVFDGTVADCRRVVGVLPLSSELRKFLQPLFNLFMLALIVMVNENEKLNEQRACFSVDLDS